MAGVLLLIMGLTGLGSAVKFIRRPFIVGFTNGIALLIASTQIKKFLDLTTPALPGEFVARIRMLLLPKWTKHIPGSIAALALSTISTAAFHLPVETGGIPLGFPSFAIPHFQPEHLLILLSSAFTVAFLAAVESLLSVVVADGMSGDHHNSNLELVAQGIANLVSPLFGGIPATGATARPATNIRAGATTPIAGMVHAATLLMILLVAAPLARFIPLATLAAVLFVVACNMGEWREIGTILHLSAADIAVWLVTFALTVLSDLTVAVSVGMTLGSLLYIRRVAQTTTVAPVTPEYLEDGLAHILQDKEIPANLTILRIHGPFLFGTTEKLAEAMKEVSRMGDVVILRLRNMTALEATGIHALEQSAGRLHAAGKTLLLCGARSTLATDRKIRPQPRPETDRVKLLQPGPPAAFVNASKLPVPSGARGAPPANRTRAQQLPASPHATATPPSPRCQFR